MRIKDIKINKANPRIIKDERFKKLMKSISEFPKMMELDPHYCDVIIARWEKYTGKKAERIEQGE